jgi:hypothetical protein
MRTLGENGLRKSAANEGMKTETRERGGEI